MPNNIGAVPLWAPNDAWAASPPTPVQAGREPSSGPKILKAPSTSERRLVEIVRLGNAWGACGGGRMERG